MGRIPKPVYEKLPPRSCSSMREDGLHLEVSARRRVEQRLHSSTHRAKTRLQLGDVDDRVDARQLAGQLQTIGHRPDARQHLARSDELRKKFARRVWRNLEVLRTHPDMSTNLKINRDTFFVRIGSHVVSSFFQLAHHKLITLVALLNKRAC